MLTILFIIQLDFYIFLGKEINDLHMTPFQTQTAREFIHTSVGSNISVHIPHPLKLARESIYLADKNQFPRKLERK
jgi:hypothetical protein